MFGCVLVRRLSLDWLRRGEMWSCLLRRFGSVRVSRAMESFGEAVEFG